MTASQLNSEFNNAINCVNSIDESNILPAANFDPLVINASIAGDGLGRNGSTGVLSVNTDGTTIETNSDALRVKDSGITTAKVADLNITLAKLSAAVAASLVPPGAVTAYAGTSAPTGYLLCDGTAVSRLTYADLFAVIGTTHGQGDGVSTFNLPDYRGRFLRGRDGGTARDPDAASRTAMASGGATGDAVGSLQDEAYHTHTHTLNGATNVVIGLSSGMGYQSNSGEQRSLSTITANASGGNETRPKNANVNWIIKY